VFTEEGLSSLKNKTLVVQGIEDGVVPVSASKKLVDILPDARLILLEKTGHWPQFEQPERFNDLLLKHLEID
jgi:pimeloyl-ACP methyl ester carboxylesterase